MDRKIKKFGEDNWWLWGRGFYDTNDDRIYVNCKSRDNKPFFTHECKSYDGSVLAIFPKRKIDIKRAIELLNNVDWDDLGFKVGGRLCFSQKSLENSYLPNTFNELL
jgi:adenine-specific DNA-methyltransferase